MPDHEKPDARGLFGGVFARGGVEAGDAAWLQAMLDAEAGLARALDQAGLAPAGAGEAVTAAARAGNFDPNELGGLAALTGNPVPGLARLDEARAGLDAVGPRLAVQFGGAAGTLASLGEAGQRVTALLATELGLAVPVLPWHTDRLRIIDLGAALARVAAVLGKIARDVTLLAQSEVGEVSEGGGPAEARADQRGADQQAPAVSPRRGGSSAMPHKRNPVASIAILGCTRQVPGLLATLAAASEQELQRAAGAWHAEWEPLTALLRLTGSASSWAADLLPGLVVDTSRMAANLAATKGLPLAEHVSSLLAGVLGGAQAHDLVAEAGARAVSAGLPLRDVLLAVPKLEERLSSAGITAEQIDSALEPSGYLGSAGAFVTAALDAHEKLGNLHG